ncbi:phosphate ABC transporter substrate-binding protein PstS [Corynebacterium propinquum]|uniref:phosphate ABC transporter substrate-binding protein PstS n=1 Tax=Corynebacterium propinquum TaxID=43769 RepID=UPI003B63AE2B
MTLTNRTAFSRTAIARNKLRQASAALAAVALSASLIACSEVDEAASTADDAADSDHTATGELIGEGASSQQNAMDYFGVQFNSLTDATLAYNPTGSGSGQTEFIAGNVDFAGSDSPLKDDQIQAAADRCEGNDAWHLPMVIGPVAIAYNLEGVDGELNLPVDTVAKIFSGEITSWNDPEIAEANPDAELPDTKITVVYRSDESGTSDNFQKFLTASTGHWDSAGKQFPQKIGEGANGSSGVASQTGSIDGAITYVESGFAEQTGLGIARLDFGSGPVELSEESVGVALDNLKFTGAEGDEAPHNMVVDSDALFASDDEGAYPLILTTYEIVCSDGYDEETETQVKDFLNVMLESQDDELAASGYIPVTGEHLQRLHDAVDAIGAGSGASAGSGAQS